MALIINGETIDNEIIEGEFRQIKGHYERTLQVACCERDPEFLGYAKDNITARVLLNQEALKRFPEVTDEEVDSRLEKLIAEAGGEDQFFYKIGMPTQDRELVRGNVASGVRLDKTLGEVYGEQKEPTESEMRAFYEKNIEQFKTEEYIEASHITKGMEGAKSRADVYAKMREIREQLMNGYDFAKMAEEHRGNEQQQIDLGWFKRGEFMEEFETIAFSMREGEISPVFTTQLGFHICKLTGRRPPAPAPFDEIKDIVRGRMSDEYRDSKFNAFVESLKAAAKIEETDCGEGCGCH
jgi:parvulin-like peptidyl-prolyl isomerase